MSKVLMWINRFATVLGYIGMLVLIWLVCGCASDNLYYEHDAVGLDLTFPVFGQRMGIVVGSVKSTSTAVHGGTSFSSQSTSGTGINGNSTVARTTTFRSNSQLNEANVVKVMESPSVPDKAKAVLAKQFGDGVVAPDFEPVAMRTRDGVIYSNGYKGSHIPNDFQATGVDKILDEVGTVVSSVTGGIADTTTAVIGGATDSLTGVTHNIFLARVWAGVSAIALCLLAAFLLRKGKKPEPHKPRKKTTVPPVPEVTPDPDLDHADDQAGIVDLPEGAEVVEEETGDDEEAPKPDKPLAWYKKLFRFIFRLIGGWFSIDEGDRADIIAKIRKHRNRK